MKLSTPKPALPAALPWAITPAARRPLVLTVPTIGEDNVPSDASPRRTKLWQLSPTLHCSVIGTCLTTGELRVLLRKFNAVRQDNATDHELHSAAVSAASRHDLLGKQLQKALDQRHRLTIGRFAGAD